jgi:aldose 1-epimerase
MFSDIRIADPVSGAAAVIVPGLGFNCISFEARIADQAVRVIDSPDDVLSGKCRPSSYGIPLLFPFPNRIRDGHFDWDGQHYEVPLSPGHPNAIHGFCYDRPWRVSQHSHDTLSGKFQLSIDAPECLKSWPTDFLFEVRYHVVENRLECQFRISNPSDRPLPWGLGTHSYFRLPFGTLSQPEDCRFAVPVSEEWELQDYLPTGRRLPIENRDPLRTGVRFGTRRFDNVYTGWQSDGGTLRSSIVDEAAGIELVQICDSQYFREAVVFTPPGRNAVCIEPYTCVTDAINLQSQDLNTGLQVLPPGGVVQTWTALQVSPLLA